MEAMPSQKDSPRGRLRAAYTRAADNPAALSMLADAHQTAVNSAGEWEQRYKDLMVTLAALVDQLGGQVTIADARRRATRRALVWTTDVMHNGLTLRVGNDQT